LQKIAPAIAFAGQKRAKEHAMWFTSEKAEKIGPKVAAKIGKELSIPAPPYETVAEGNYKPGSLGQALGDLSTALFGGSTRPIVSVRLDIPQPRPFELTAHVIKAGSQIVLGSLLYSIKLARTVPGAIMLEDAKVFSKSKFTGGNGTADKLNGDADLIKKVNAFVRTKYQVNNDTIRTERFLKIEPMPDGSVLAINTLPRSKWLGLASTFDALAFLEIALAVEKVL
jgi:hypothetical protein